MTIPENNVMIGAGLAFLAFEKAFKMLKPFIVKPKNTGSDYALGKIKEILEAHLQRMGQGFITVEKTLTSIENGIGIGNNRGEKDHSRLQRVAGSIMGLSAECTKDFDKLNSSVNRIEADVDIIKTKVTTA